MASERILICEGDSITGGYSTAYPYVATYSPGVMGANYAISGSTISSISSRASVIDAIWPSDIATTTKKYIFSLLIGANDLTAYSAATVTSTYIPLLQSYLTSRRAAGAGNIKIVLCTVTPRTDSTFNTNRAVLNSWITTSAVSGGWADAIADFAGDATIGADASASNATYYRDGLHPTDAGFAVMAPIFASAVGSI
jgi:lysophospholipase L1-like esterase